MLLDTILTKKFEFCKKNRNVKENININFATLLSEHGLHEVTLFSNGIVDHQGYR